MAISLFFIGATVTVLAISKVFYNLFLHPLASVPGPFLCRISSLPSFYHACTGDRHIWLWRNFEIYGDKVRTTPNTILFNSPEAYNSIYDPRANLMRSTSYHMYSRNCRDYNTLTTTDVQGHAKKRKLLKLAFTDRSIKAAAGFIVSHIDRWIELRASESPLMDWSAAEDISKHLDFLIFDILGDLCLGQNFGTKERSEKNPIKVILHLIARYMAFQYPITKSPLRSLILWLKPRGLNRLVGYCPPQHVKDFYAFVQRSLDQRLDRYPKSVGPVEQQSLGSATEDTSREDMIHFLVTAKIPETDQPVFTKDELLAEARLLLIAGTDTTATSLSAFFFYITTNPRVYRKLISELRSTFKASSEIVLGPKLASCHYLSVVIDETLRMTPAGPSEPERIVRHGGATIGGNFFPEGTNVGIPQWAYYHNEDIFGDANTFRPERWVESADNSIEDIRWLKRVYSPFLKGVHNCVGQNLARLLVSLTVAKTLWALDCRAAPGSSLGGGRKDLGWGRRDRRVYQVTDAFISLRQGPMVQFRRRENYPC